MRTMRAGPLTALPPLLELLLLLLWFDSVSAPIPTLQTEVDGLEAAFDFRRSLDNLVNRRTFVIEDSFGVRRTAEDGACFQVDRTDYSNSEFYNVGGRIPYDESIVASKEWTMFFRMSNRNSNSDSQHHFAGFQNFQPTGSSNGIIQYAFLTKTGSTMQTYVWDWTPVNSSMMIAYYSKHSFPDLRCFDSWCDVRLAVRQHQADATIDGKPQSSEFHLLHFGGPGAFDLQQIRIGHVLANSHSPPEFCIRCFGVAQRHLSEEEVRQAMSAFCPADIV